MSALVTVRPSSKRSRFSRSTLMEKGSCETPFRPFFSASTSKYAVYSLLPTVSVWRALKLSSVVATGGSPPRNRRLSSTADRDVVALRGARVELARTADLLGRVADHLLPLCDPPRRARDRKQDREHVGREAHRLQGDA